MSHFYNKGYTSSKCQSWGVYYIIFSLFVKKDTKIKSVNEGRRIIYIGSMSIKHQVYGSFGSWLELYRN